MAKATAAATEVVAEEAPLTATVLAIAGKYAILDQGSAEGVKIGDVFEHQQQVLVKHPRMKDPFWAKYGALEMYVERVESNYCYAVFLFSEKVPYFEYEDIKAGKCQVVRGHPHRITTAASINRDRIP